MNFDYIKEAEPETEELRQLYDRLYNHLLEAENLYWSKPQKSGRYLRKATEEVCQIYNLYYEIGFAPQAELEDYLCYTKEEEHNVMVSRFLSVIRKEQRDHLEWLRVWGDECIFMDTNPEEIVRNSDKLYLNVRKMMSSMLNVTKEMCRKLNHMEGLENIRFQEEILPGYVSVEEQEELELQRQQEEKAKKGIFAKLFGK